MTLAQINKKLKKYLPEIKKKYKVKSLGIFGSYVRNKQKKGSDIDILVEFSETPGLFKFVELAFFLEELLGLKVDLVTKEALRPIMKKNILNEAVYL